MTEKENIFYEMITPEEALKAIPEGLRIPLIEEYNAIVNNFMEHRWDASELKGGRFCEIVHTILINYTSGSYPSKPIKPRNFVDACRRLENNTAAPRSFQILIPRLLPALYEIRNNRNVGHVGGGVIPDFMDSSVVVSLTSWILAELVRVFHDISTEEAQKLVDKLVERRLPLVWKSGDIRRVLNPRMSCKDQILTLLSSCSSKTSTDDLCSWIEQKNRSYFHRLLRELHDHRLVEFNETNNQVELLPPGTEYVAKLLAK